MILKLFFAKTLAVALPIPLVAPVISAVFNLFMLFSIKGLYFPCFLSKWQTNLLFLIPIGLLSSIVEF